MSAPRRVVKGTTYLLSRRCSQRQFLLTPSALVNQIFLYCLAVAASRCDMLVHGVCVLGNHYHLVVTDVYGKLPQFMHWLNMFVAKCLNAHYGRWESFWAPGSYSGVDTVERNDIVAKVVYTLNNPVDAGLVATGEQWPGLRSRPEDIYGSSWTVKRPKGFFRDNGNMPEEATLTFAPPPNLEGAELERFVGDVTEVLAVAEQTAQEKMKREGRRFLGRKAVLKQRPTDAPTSREPRRGLNPRVACRDKWRRIEVLGRLRSFYDAYRAAWLQFKHGARDVLFPPGTYWLARHAGVRCSDYG